MKENECNFEGTDVDELNSSSISIKFNNAHSNFEAMNKADQIEG